MTKTPSIIDKYPNYEVVIGIEVHVQLTTKSKIFCTCANEVGEAPNQNICNICAGYPGSLPVLNKKVVDYAILAGLATNCTIAKKCAFDRKHYFYPDLPKNYQITQQFEPICTDGYVSIRLEDGSTKKIRLIRIHIEEDAGKSIHASGTRESLVDLNRTGTPLLEIVSQPDINSTYEAKAYLRTLRTTVQYLGVCTGNMEEGAFRADTNISVRKKGETKLGTKCELKNINSFKFIGDAIEHEIERHIEILEAGSQVMQETRLWDSKRGQTFMMRTKEEAPDYRYFEDPDLPILNIDPEHVNYAKKILPELPYEKFDRYITQKGLTPYEAEIIIEDKELVNYFEQASALSSSKLIINWILRDLIGYINKEKTTLAECKVTPEKLASLINLIESGTINNQSAQKVFNSIAHTGKDPITIVKEEGLEQIGSADELEHLVKEIIAHHPQEVANYKAGKEQLFGFFVGQAMKKTGGKANPRMLQELFKKYLV